MPCWSPCVLPSAPLNNVTVLQCICMSQEKLFRSAVLQTADLRMQPRYCVVCSCLPVGMRGRGLQWDMRARPHRTLWRSTH